jgi:diaminopropionate ammonia-lyase
MVMDEPLPEMRFCLTPPDEFCRPWGTDQETIITAAEHEQALSTVSKWPGYAPTALIGLPVLAHELGVAQIAVKDEGQRFAVGSFKALGPPYALAHLLAAIVARRTGREQVPVGDLLDGKYRSITSEVCSCAATSGNHGRALAWAAQSLGCRCVIFIPEQTSAHRKQAVSRFGAQVVRVPGNFDSSVIAARATAEREGWIMVGEVAPRDWPDVPRHILHGYSVLGAELIAASSERRPTHVFVSAGSGKLAAGIVAALWLKYGSDRPRVVVVQPHSADCVYQSALARNRTPAAGDLVTLMDGLAVGQVSVLAWPILRGGAAASITISEESAIRALRRLARPQPGDPVVELGETGVAAFAGLLAVAANPEARRLLQLNETSQVIAIGCEGVTDPEIYQRLVNQ